MINFIKGNVEIIKPTYIVINCNNIGYKIFVNNKSLNYLSANRENAKLFTYMVINMNVKQDNISLYGFLSEKELDVFEILISVAGVGPKVGVAFLDYMTPNLIAEAIILKDIKALCSVAGIGKKVAERIVLELKDKVEFISPINNNLCPKSINSINQDDENINETIEALTALGFTKPEILTTISKLEDKTINSNKMISLALKNLNLGK